MVARQSILRYFRAGGKTTLSIHSEIQPPAATLQCIGQSPALVALSFAIVLMLSPSMCYQKGSSSENDPPSCPPTSVVLVLKLNSLARIKELRKVGCLRSKGRWFESTRAYHSKPPSSAVRHALPARCC
jgi:hypothetical protein